MPSSSVYSPLRLRVSGREDATVPPSGRWPNSVYVQTYTNRLCLVRTTFSIKRPMPAVALGVRHQLAAPIALLLRASPKMPARTASTPTAVRKCHTKLSPMAPHRNLSPLSKLVRFRGLRVFGRPECAFARRPPHCRNSATYFSKYQGGILDTYSIPRGMAHFRGLAGHHRGDGRALFVAAKCACPALEAAACFAEQRETTALLTLKPRSHRAHRGHRENRTNSDN